VILACLDSGYVELQFKLLQCGKACAEEGFLDYFGGKVLDTWSVERSVRNENVYLNQHSWRARLSISSAISSPPCSIVLCTTAIHDISVLQIYFFSCSTGEISTYITGLGSLV
jgi:hypothetical protein